MSPTSSFFFKRIGDKLSVAHLVVDTAQNGTDAAGEITNWDKVYVLLSRRVFGEGFGTLSVIPRSLSPVGIQVQYCTGNVRGEKLSTKSRWFDMAKGHTLDKFGLLLRLCQVQAFLVLPRLLPWVAFRLPHSTSHCLRIVNEKSVRNIEAVSYLEQDGCNFHGAITGSHVERRLFTIGH